MEASFDGGFPLINRCAPAPYYELAGIGLPFSSCPFNLLSFHHREMVVAAIAAAFLGSRIAEQVNLETSLHMPAGARHLPFFIDQAILQG